MGDSGLDNTINIWYVDTQGKLGDFFIRVGWDKVIPLEPLTQLEATTSEVEFGVYDHAL